MIAKADMIFDFDWLFKSSLICIDFYQLLSKKYIVPPHICQLGFDTCKAHKMEFKDLLLCSRTQNKSDIQTWLSSTFLSHLKMIQIKIERYLQQKSYTYPATELSETLIMWLAFTRKTWTMYNKWCHVNHEGTGSGVTQKHWPPVHGPPLQVHRVRGLPTCT